MKAWISFLLLVDLGLHAQSTTHFVANIPLGGNPNQYGTGTFELNGSSLSYSIVFTTLPSLITDVVIAPVGAQVTRPVMWGTPSVSPVIFDLMKTESSHLSSQGVYIGTCSWKYPGLREQLYAGLR